MATEKEVLDAVERYAYNRHSHLTKSNVIGWTEEELERVKVDQRGYLVFTVEDLRIEETKETDDGPIWYVSATCWFQVTSGEPIESDEDVYEAYKGDKGEWVIQWDHC